MSAGTHDVPGEAGSGRPGPASSGVGLVADGLTKRFGTRTVLAPVDLGVAPGEVLALTGANGSGKTTLLRILAGSLDPDGGSVTWRGRPIRESDAWSRREVATLLDDAATFPDLSVGEHLELLARGFAAPDPAATVAAVLADVGLGGRTDQLPATLSSGQRHRLGLASVLVRPAGLLLLDEPEQRLDGVGRQWLAGRLRDLADGGCSVVLASHDRDLVDEVADLVLELQ